MYHLFLSVDNGVRSEYAFGSSSSVLYRCAWMVLFCTSLGLVYRLNFVGGLLYKFHYTRLWIHCLVQKQLLY